MPSCYIQISGRNCGIMLTGTASYHSRPAPFATQLLPICCQYMYANFAWRCNMYYLGLTHLIAGIYMPISRLRLKVRYVFPWPTYLIARSAPSCNLIIAYLLPIYICRFYVLRLEVQFVLL